jgi:hypothetical protein
MDEFQRDKFETSSLEPSDDISDESSLDTIRLSTNPHHKRKEKKKEKDQIGVKLGGLDKRGYLDHDISAFSDRHVVVLSGGERWLIVLYYLCAPDNRYNRTCQTHSHIIQINTNNRKELSVSFG